jgi:1-acyl-sn-glycerol-3-phosphate acyltransferase
MSHPVNFKVWFKAIQVAGLITWAGIAMIAIHPVLKWSLGRRSTPVWDSILRHWYASICRILGVNLTIKGEICPTAGLMVSNHVSWLDILALGSLQTADFVAKEEVASWPVLGFLVNKAGTLFVRRGDNQQTQGIAEQIAWRLRQGRRVIVFPEGTSTDGKRVLRFHSKLFQPMQLTGATVQAVALQYRNAAVDQAPFIGDDEFLPHLLRLIKLDRIDLHIHFCEPLPHGVSAGDAARATRSQVLSALDMPISARDAQRLNRDASALQSGAAG